MAHEALRKLIYAVGLAALIGALQSGRPQLLLAQRQSSVRVSATVVNGEASIEGQQLAMARATQLAAHRHGPPSVDLYQVIANGRFATVRSEPRSAESEPQREGPSTLRLVVEFAGN